MGIFSRTRDIIVANVADLLDRREDPAGAIRATIQAMEETLGDARTAAARHIADQKEMRRHKARLEQARDGWTEKAELALARGREDLARAALAEKQQAGTLVARLDGEIAAIEETLAACEADMARLQDRLHEARARQNAVLMRTESAHHRSRMRELATGGRTEAALSGFTRLERRVDLAEGHAEAIGLGRDGARDGFGSLPAERIEAELAAMKARLAVGEGRMAEGLLAIGAIFIVLPWLFFRHLVQGRRDRPRGAGDEALLDELYDLAHRLDERLNTIERIIAADDPVTRRPDRARLADERGDLPSPERTPERRR